MSEGEAETAAVRPRRFNWRIALMAVVGLTGVLVAAALVATLGAANRQRDRALERQSHSYEVMILTRSLTATMAKAEATLGRFVISGDKTIGRQYYEDWRYAGHQLRRLDWATRNNAAQEPQVEALKRAYRERGEELALIALNTNYGRNNQALSAYYAARDTRSLRRLGDLLEAITTAERERLQARTAAATRSVERSNLIAAVLASFGMLLLAGAIVLGWVMVRAMGERAVANAAARAERERAIELQAAVDAATAELQQEAREREAAEAQLRQIQKMEAVGQLTGGIAHDFNNMLAVVLGGLELAKRHLNDPAGSARRHLDNAAEGANRAAALTRRLLAFARAEPLLPEAVEAGALIGGMSDLLDRTLGETIAVEARDAGLGWRIWVDRHQLENALLNLAVNARDAMDGHGQLVVETGGTTLNAGEVGECDAGEYVTIAVRDSGCGMAPEVLERVFEPFFTTKPVGKGTGLGLSQIFGFVRQSSGEIAITSAPGEGTTVTLYLPRHVAGEQAAPVPQASGPDAVPASTSGLSILVVEDDPRVLASTIEVLRELGHDPVACDNPAHARAIVEARADIDLILSDVLMAGLSGPEMVAGIKEVAPDIAVVFVTGYAGDISDTEKFGGHNVLRKPFTIAALAAAIDAAMADRAPTPERRRMRG